MKIDVILYAILLVGMTCILLFGCRDTDIKGPQTGGVSLWCRLVDCEA